MWPDRRILDLFNIRLPIIQAPMAGSSGSDLAIAVSEAGGLGSLPCGMLSPEQARNEVGIIRQRTSGPINLNFMCHRQSPPNPTRMAAWKTRLKNYYDELGIDPDTPPPAGGGRGPFDEAMCDLVTEVKPEVVSFHYGLPERRLVDRVKSAGIKIISSATCVDEARWLADQGCDAVIAQGYEAGGHRGMFLTDDVASQVGTMALIPQVVDAVKVPVIASGGIADARGIAAAFVLGAAAVQLGTAYLICPESKANDVYRKALKGAKDNGSVLTNVFSGRPARSIVNRIIREVGPISDAAPEFPYATPAIMPLRAKAEAGGSDDFSPLLAGQAAALARELPAGEVTRRLAEEALARLGAG